MRSQQTDPARKETARFTLPHGMSLRTGCGSRPPETVPNRRTNTRTAGLYGRGEGDPFIREPSFSSATDVPPQTTQSRKPPLPIPALHASHRSGFRTDLFRRSDEPPQQPVRSSAADERHGRGPDAPSRRPAPAGGARPRPPHSADALFPGERPAPPRTSSGRFVRLRKSTQPANGRKRDAAPGRRHSAETRPRANRLCGHVFRKGGSPRNERADPDRGPRRSRRKAKAACTFRRPKKRVPPSKRTAERIKTPKRPNGQKRKLT